MRYLICRSAVTSGEVICGTGDPPRPPRPAGSWARPTTVNDRTRTEASDSNGRFIVSLLAGALAAARISVSDDPSLRGSVSMRGCAHRSSSTEVERHARHDHVWLEKQRPLDEQRMLV